MDQSLLTEYYNTNDEKKRKELIENLLENYKFYLDLVLQNISLKKELRNDAYLLNLMSKKKRVNDYLKKVFTKEHFNILINDSDPKTRKNAYVFMGNYLEKQYAIDLIKTLKNENINYCISSLILTLGNYNIKNIEEIMDKYLVILNKKYENKEIEKVHYDEILNSINKVINKNKKVEANVFTKLNKEEKFLLTCMKPLINTTFNDLKREFKDAQKYYNGVLVKTDNLDKLFKFRTFYEALLVTDNNLDLDKKELINNINDFLKSDFLISSHLQKHSFLYRIEYVSTKNKKEKQEMYNFINDFIEAEFKDKYSNNPSLYEFEIRIIDNSNNKYDVFYKLCTYKDKRFDYRLRDLPASINQVSASIMLNEVKKYLKKGANVLDPFCGSGTMLIERNYVSNVKSLTGVDISSEAIECANTNCKKANIDIKLINKNCLDHKGKYDEIISNMPYGNRVGNHSKNEILYRSFINQLDDLLEDAGVAILLTSEISLMKNMIKENHKLKLIEDIYTETGGLTPHLFIIKKR